MGIISPDNSRWITSIGRGFRIIDPSSSDYRKRFTNGSRAWKTGQSSSNNKSVGRGRRKIHFEIYSALNHLSRERC